MDEYYTCERCGGQVHSISRTTHDARCLKQVLPKASLVGAAQEEHEEDEEEDLDAIAMTAATATSTSATAPSAPYAPITVYGNEVNSSSSSSAAASAYPGADHRQERKRQLEIDRQNQIEGLATDAGNSSLPVAVAVDHTQSHGQSQLQVQGHQQQGHWECSFCTYHNQDDGTRGIQHCEACENPREGQGEGRYGAQRAEAFVEERRQQPTDGRSRDRVSASSVSGALAAAGYNISPQAGAWVCASCTFQNIHGRNTVCDMCGTERRGGGIVRADAVEEGWDSDGDGIRAPDATVRERLIGGHAPQVVRTSIPTGGGASGLEAADDEDDGFNNLALGALVGGIFGGVASMLGGSGSDGSRRSDSREGGFMWGALQGAAYGAAASSTFAGGSTRVSYSSGGSRNSSGSRSSFQRRTSAGAGGASANTFESMLRFLLSHGDTGTSAGAATPNVDQMSYDQLLARFGFGTDARAASESTISSLPTEVLAEDNVDDSGLPNQCAICLENLLCGEQVRRLPCKHIYHTACIDEWLRNVSSCPVCKSRV